MTAKRSPPTKARCRPQFPSCSALSCRLPHRGGYRFSLHVADFHACADRALAAVFEGDLGSHVGLLGTVVKRLDQRRVAICDEAAPHFLSARQLAVVGIKLLVQD